MQSCSRTATVSLKNPNFWTAISWQLTKDFISFMRDSDTSTWPRLDDKWLYLVIKNSKEVQLLPSPPDLKMTPNYPLQLGADPKWG